MINIDNTIDGLLELTKKYYTVKRATVNFERWTQWRGELEVDDDRVKENLVEHVGLLPIIASYIYRYIPTKTEINLGHCLEILAIHEIGETVTGDIPTSLKTDKDRLHENMVVKDLLEGRMYELYEEFEEQKTNEAKLAKSVDYFGTFVDDLLLPKDVLIKRWDRWGFTLDKLRGFVGKYYDWDENVHDLFEGFMGKYQKCGFN